MAEDKDKLFCNLCKKMVNGGGHPCIREDGSGRPEEHLAECIFCGTFHEPHCADTMAAAERWNGPRVHADAGSAKTRGQSIAESDIGFNGLWPTIRFGQSSLAMEGIDRHRVCKWLADLIDDACAEAVKEERRTNADAVFSLGAANALKERDETFRRDLAKDAFLLRMQFGAPSPISVMATLAFADADAFIAEQGKKK